MTQLREKDMNIEQVTPADYPELLVIWEDSVRATHDFITEEDIEFFKPMIMEQAFPAVTLRCVRDNTGTILGFIGIDGAKIEMLFLRNSARGKGIGTQLLSHVVETFGCNKVDVNEQNPQAAGFYQHFGFKVESRSPLDGMGKPFPILHLKL